MSIVPRCVARKPPANTTTMPAYLVAQIRVSDPTVWSEYRAGAAPLAEKFGARQLVRGAEAETLEGSQVDFRMVVFEFPSMQSIHDFWNSEEYLALKALREGAAVLDIWAVEGM